MANRIFNRALKIVGSMALLAAFAVPVANAETAKRVIVKKQHVTKASASKKVVSTRKSVRFAAGGKHRTIIRAAVPAKPSFGQIAGLHSAQDPLDLKSSVALVIDQ
ncbi:MAG: peptidase S11, partial [Polaromonas sp.]